MTSCRWSSVVRSMVKLLIAAWEEICLLWTWRKQMVGVIWFSLLLKRRSVYSRNRKRANDRVHMAFLTQEKTHWCSPQRNIGMKVQSTSNSTYEQVIPLERSLFSISPTNAHLTNFVDRGISFNEEQFWFWEVIRVNFYCSLCLISMLSDHSSQNKLNIKCILCLEICFFAR